MISTSIAVAEAAATAEVVATATAEDRPPRIAGAAVAAAIVPVVEEPINLPNAVTADSENRLVVSKISSKRRIPEICDFAAFRRQNPPKLGDFRAIFAQN